MTASSNIELWCLHGAVGQAADWKDLAAGLSGSGMLTRSVDLWRFLDCCPMSMPEFGRALNAEAIGAPGQTRKILVGYSMGGRLALHALLEPNSPWEAAVLISAHPGLESEVERAERRSRDAAWAAMALSGEWGEFLDAWQAQPILGGMSEGMGDRRLLGQRRKEIARSFMDWSLGAQEPLWDRLPEIQVPLRWVVGERDPKFLDLGKRAVSLLPLAQLIQVAGAGHRVPWEAPQAWRGVVTGLVSAL